MPGNQLKELHQRSPADLVANLESEQQFRKKRDFEQSTSRLVPGLVSTGESFESAEIDSSRQNLKRQNTKRQNTFQLADDSSLAAVHGSDDEEAPHETIARPKDGSTGSIENDSNGLQQTNRKPAQFRLKEKLRNFVIKNNEKLMKSRFRFISQMPNCGQRICAILETLQISTYYVSTLTMAGKCHLLGGLKN